MQFFLKILSTVSIIAAVCLIFLTCAVLFGVAMPVVILGILISFFYAYLCWSRPLARTISTVVSLVLIVVLGSFLYSMIPERSFDRNMDNYLRADDAFTKLAATMLPADPYIESALTTNYTYCSFGTNASFIRLDYSFEPEAFDEQLLAFEQRYRPGNSFALDAHTEVYPISAQDTCFFAYIVEPASSCIRLYFMQDPLLVNVEPQTLLSEWQIYS